MRKLLTLLFMIAATPAAAHSWYPEGCCRENHCHPAPCDSIKPDRGGFWWFDDATQQVIHFESQQMKPSQDEFCHVCVTGWTGVCIFLPWRS
jgi:hypothetical protein